MFFGPFFDIYIFYFLSIFNFYLSQKAYQSAIAAFQQGLGLAQQLKYREDYFVKKIDLANRQMNR